MRTPSPPLQPGTAPDTFRVANWRVFAPGFHKGRLYTPADCAATVRNFELLSAGENPTLRVKAKFGHDADQRIAQSLGVMNAGLVTACRAAPDGGFAIDVDGIPATLMIPDAETGEPVAFDLKKAFDDGNICDGSVELVWDAYPDPANPTQMLPGPVLEAVAFLGEERPGVKGLPRPVATFSDRTRSGPRRARVVFSEVDPMPTRDDILQQLQAANIDVSDPQIAALPDEALYALLKQVTGDTFAAAMKAKYAAVPANPDPKTNAPPAADTKPAAKMGVSDPDNLDAVKGFAAKFDDLMDQMGKMTARLSSCEQAVQATQDQAKMAAQFAADFHATAETQKKQLATETVDRAVREGRAMPHARDYLLADLLKLPNGRKDVFAAGHAQAGRTPFESACAALLARPVTHLFSDTADPTPDADDLTPFQRKALDATPTGKRVARADAVN